MANGAVLHQTMLPAYSYLPHKWVKKYHHTLMQILNGLLKTGFVIETVEETMPPEQWRDQMPDTHQHSFHPARWF